ATQRDYLFVESRILRPAPRNLPKHRHTLKERRVARFRRVAHFHPVVQKRHAVNREHECGASERCTSSKLRDSALLIMVVRESHLERAARAVRVRVLPDFT